MRYLDALRSTIALVATIAAVCCAAAVEEVPQVAEDRSVSGQVAVVSDGRHTLGITESLREEPVEEAPVAEPVEVPEEAYDPEWPESTVAMVAKLIYGEARGCSTTEQAAVVWTVLNRVDHEAAYFADTIEEVILQKNAYAGYREDFPATEDLMALAEDVLDRWALEDLDGEDHGRVLPEEYLYFHGDGRVNWFRTDYEHTGEYWDWSLASPYDGGAHE